MVKRGETLMGSINDIAGGRGARHALPEYNGHKYYLGHITNRVRDSFAKNGLQRAMQAETLLKEARTPEDYSRRLDAIADKYRRGEFGILSFGGLAYFATIQGVQFLLTEIIQDEAGEKVSEDTAFALIVNFKTEIMSIVRLVFKESFPGLDMDKKLTPEEQAKVMEFLRAAESGAPIPSALTASVASVPLPPSSPPLTAEEIRGVRPSGQDKFKTPEMREQLAKMRQHRDAVRKSDMPNPTQQEIDSGAGIEIPFGQLAAVVGVGGLQATTATIPAVGVVGPKKR